MLWGIQTLQSRMEPWLLLLLVKEVRSPPELELEEGKENQLEPAVVVDTELEV